MSISVIGIDIAKAVFYLVGINEEGCVIYRVKVKRAQLLKTLANIPVCVVAMEACGSSNYWAREIEKLGFEVKLLPATSPTKRSMWQSVSVPRGSVEE